MLPRKYTHRALLSEKGKLDSGAHSMIPFYFIIFFNNKVYI